MDAVNYGGIGAVIGHELSHHFDDQGAKYDREGRLSDWWTESDVKAFEAAGEALIAVSASGINRPDVLQRKGLYPPPAGASDGSTFGCVSLS